LKVSAEYFGNFSWKSSLLLKLTVLSVGAVFVYWAGWPQPSIHDASRPSAFQEDLQSSDFNLPRTSGFTQDIYPDGALPHHTSTQPVQDGVDRTIVERGEDIHIIVDLNDGTVTELENLPGIGRILAERIVTYRTSHGAFRQIEELALVPGIGDKRLQQLRPFVVVQNSLNQ
jgi:competence protein ComEA